MNELNKIKNIGYNCNCGAIMYEDESLQFNVGDKNTAFIQLRGNLDSYIKAQLKVKTPTGEVVLINSKILNLKNVCREFPVVVDEAGKYEAQLILSFKDKTNVSNIFSYTVNKSIGGDK